MPPFGNRNKDISWVSNLYKFIFNVRHSKLTITNCSMFWSANLQRLQAIKTITILFFKLLEISDGQTAFLSQLTYISALLLVCLPSSLSLKFLKITIKQDWYETNSHIYSYLFLLFTFSLLVLLIFFLENKVHWYLGSFGPQYTPIPALAPWKPLLIHAPSVYTVTGPIKHRK